MPDTRRNGNQITDNVLFYCRQRLIFQQLHHIPRPRIPFSKSKKARERGMRVFRKQFRLLTETVAHSRVTSIVARLVTDAHLQRRGGAESGMNHAIYLATSTAPKKCRYAPIAEHLPLRESGMCVYWCMRGEKAVKRNGCGIRCHRLSPALRQALLNAPSCVTSSGLLRCVQFRTRRQRLPASRHLPRHA